MRPVSSRLVRLPRLGLPRLALLPVGRWMSVARERRRLAELSDHALRDIGLTREQARNEAARPFWDAPGR